MKYFSLLLFLLPITSAAQENVVDDIRALIQGGLLAEAENLTNRYIVDDPTNVDLLMMKGNVELNKYLVEQQAQQSLVPRFDESIYNAGTVELGPKPVTVPLEIAAKVNKLWRAAATLAPERSDLHLGVCQVYAISGQRDALLDYLPTVRENANDVEDLHFHLSNYAQNLRERGDEEGAMAVFRKVAELFPERPGLLSDLAGAYFFGGNLDSARAYVAQSLEDENAAEAIVGNAFFFSSLMGDYDQALSAIRRLPGDGHLLYEGVLKFYRGEKKWEKPVEKFLEGKPDSVDAAAAEILLADSFQLDMDHYLVLLELELGDPIKILIHQKFRETGEFLPSFNAAETYAFHRRYPAAAEIFQQIEQDEPMMEKDDLDNFYFYYAWTLHQLGQRDAADAKWRKLLESEDFYKKSAAHWFVGKYLFDQGKKMEGREFFQKMASRSGDTKFAAMCWQYMGVD